MEKNLRIIIAVLLSFAAIISAKADSHDEFLPDAKLKAGVAKVTVEIKNYNPSHEASMLLGDITPLASPEYLNLNIPINENGKATADILQVILDKYKVKTIVIDIWATWCGPCLLAHKQLEPLKDELNDENIVFVYLTSDVSPLEKWETMVPEIKGEHFYLTNDQLYSILEHYNSTGFPTYAVYDRNAALLYSGIGFPGVDKIKSLIAK